MQGCVQHAFDPCVFDVSQQNAAVALFEGLCVTFEDVEEFLDDGRLVDGIIVPDNDSAIPHISVDGDALVLGRTRGFVGRHLDFRWG